MDGKETHSSVKGEVNRNMGKWETKKSLQFVSDLYGNKQRVIREDIKIIISTFLKL